MAKKKVISIIPDDLFEDCKVSPRAYDFGSFRIVGDVELIAFNKYTKVELFLYFNNWNNTFKKNTKTKAYPSSASPATNFSDLMSLSNTLISRSLASSTADSM